MYRIGLEPVFVGEDTGRAFSQTDGQRGGAPSTVVTKSSVEISAIAATAVAIENICYSNHASVTPFGSFHRRIQKKQTDIKNVFQKGIEGACAFKK